MTLIEYGEIRKILDSRGVETVEVDIYTVHGFGRAAAPSGASRGKHEVVPYPDGGIDRGVEIFNKEIIPNLVGHDAVYQEEIDKLLHEIDGTDNFSRIGGNVAIATSLAVAKAAADALDLPLYRYLGGMYKRMPRPLGNVLGGGKHAIGSTAIQEYLVMASGKTIMESAMVNADIHRKIGEELKRRFPSMAIGKGDEGAWSASLPDLEALEIVVDAARSASSEHGVAVGVGLDVAASHFYKNGKYYYKDRVLDTEEQIEFIAEIVEHYGITLVEDPLYEEDFAAYAKLTSAIGKSTTVVGDDLFVTSVDRLKKGITYGAANAILIKPNQVGTLTDTFRAVKMAKQHNYKVIVSHRSGETCDVALSHIAVAAEALAIKTGVVSGERVAKLNELIRIERQEESGLNE